MGKLELEKKGNSENLKLTYLFFFFIDIPVSDHISMWFHVHSPMTRNGEQLLTFSIHLENLM